MYYAISCKHARWTSSNVVCVCVCVRTQLVILALARVPPNWLTTVRQLNSLSLSLAGETYYCERCCYTTACVCGLCLCVCLYIYVRLPPLYMYIHDQRERERDSYCCLERERRETVRLWYGACALPARFPAECPSTAVAAAATTTLQGGVAYICPAVRQTRMRRASRGGRRAGARERKSDAWTCSSWGWKRERARGAGGAVWQGGERGRERAGLLCCFSTSPIPLSLSLSRSLLLYYLSLFLFMSVWVYTWMRSGLCRTHRCFSGIPSTMRLSECVRACV